MEGETETVRIDQKTTLTKPECGSSLKNGLPTNFNNSFHL